MTIPQEKSVRRSRVGKVIADKTPKTVKIELEGMVQHARYKKYIKRHTRFLAHDPQEICHVGDIVRVEETRPVSKLKTWVVREIITKAADGANDQEVQS